MERIPDRLNYKNAAEIAAALTSHKVGFKKVLSKELPETLQIKQIAIGYLKPGEVIEPHVHPDLDEYYYVLEGNGSIYLNEDMLPFQKDVFVRIPAGITHALKCAEDLTFFYFGVQIISPEQSTSFYHSDS